MSNVAVEKVRDGEATPPTLFERMTVIADRIRQKAFEGFECRGCADGRSLDDWLQAERDIVQSPEAELIEKDGKFQMRVAVPGFDSKDIRVTAMPTVLFVEAESKHEHTRSEGDVYFSPNSARSSSSAGWTYRRPSMSIKCRRASSMASSSSRQRRP
jgi:HSP20 family molecular chaperone IbpA